MINARITLESLERLTGQKVVVVKNREHDNLFLVGKVLSIGIDSEVYRKGMGTDVFIEDAEFLWQEYTRM